MTEKIKGIKLNMSQIFLDTGKVIPVTVIGKISGDLTAEMENKSVYIVGTSKGHFSGGPATGGQSTKPRAPGSIGSQTPGRVRKGKKMAGRLGGERVTIKGLKIVRVMPDQKQLMVSGPVPGARNSKITIELK